MDFLWNTFNMDHLRSKPWIHMRLESISPKVQNGPLVNLKHQIEVDCFTSSSALSFDWKQVSFCFATRTITHLQSKRPSLFFFPLKTPALSLLSFPISQINSPEKEFYRVIILAQSFLSLFSGMKLCSLFTLLKTFIIKVFRPCSLLDLPYEHLVRPFQGSPWLNK